jgi:hypothetical protein
MGFFNIPSLAIKLGLPGFLITAGGLFGGFSGWFNGAGTPVNARAMPGTPECGHRKPERTSASPTTSMCSRDGNRY